MTKSMKSFGELRDATQESAVHDRQCVTPTVIRGFPVHKYPHIDELLCRYLYEKLAAGTFGEKHVVPVAPDATFVIWTKGNSATPDGEHIDAWTSQGYLPFGIGGELAGYDDHVVDPRAATNGVPYCHLCREEGVTPKWCASDILAHSHGIQDDRRIRELLRYVHLNDVHGKGERFGLAQTVNKVQRFGVVELEELYRLVCLLVFDVEFREQERQREIAKQWRRYINVETIEVLELQVPKAIRIGIVPEDNEGCLASVARGAAQCEIVICRKPTGTVQVLLRRNSWLVRRMPSVAALLIAAEIAADPVRRSQKPSFQMLVRSDRDYLPNWHFQAETGFCFNGGESHPDAPPTHLALDRIVQIVCYGLKRWGEIENNNWARLRQHLCAASSQQHVRLSQKRSNQTQQHPAPLGTLSPVPRPTSS